MGAFFIITVSFAAIQAGLVTKNLKLAKAESELSCTEGWYPLGNLCYKGFEKPMTFDDAEKECVKLGGHLAAITSEEIQEFVLLYILLGFKHWIFIGLKLPKDGSKPMWTDGSPMEFVNWDVTQPDRRPEGGETENCIEMRFNTILDRLGKWNDIMCHYKLPYVCQKTKIIVPVGDTTAADPTVCPGSADGFRFADSCYHLISHKKPWQEAEKYCVEQYNGHLAAVKDVFVQAFLQYLMKIAGNRDRMWIGIRLMPNEIAVWLSGWYMGFTNWRDGSSHRKVESESCGSIMKGNGQWKIEACKETLSFVCEETSVVIPPRLTTTKTGLKCPYDENDWIDVGGDRCYIFQERNLLSWYRSNFYCMVKGGTLVSIHSEAEMNMLKQFITMSYDALHIGLFRVNKEEFQWADRSAVDYTKWNYGEPNSKGDLCAELLPIPGLHHRPLGWVEMKWNDVPCDNVRGFICSGAKVSSSNNSDPKTPEDQQEAKCECSPTSAIVGGGVVCILLVIALAGSVFYNMKHWRKARQESRMPKCSICEKPLYRTGKISPEQIYENIDGEI